MPFIKPERRPMVEAGERMWDRQPGDFCYLHYQRMVREWRKAPSWGRATTLYMGVNPDDVQEQLAWQVFFQLHVMPYELQKQAENGDVT